MTLLKEAVHVANNSAQTFLTEITSHATVHLSDLPFSASHLLLIGLTATASITTEVGNRVENAVEEKVQ